MSRRRFYMALMACVLGVQFGLISISLPLSELFTDTPVFYYDTAYHWYEIWFAKSISHTGSWVGYDPLFSAGQVNGVNLNFSAKSAALISIMGGTHISPAMAYKLMMAGTAVGAPLALVSGAYWLSLSRRVGAVAAILAIVMWWASDFRSYTSIGMVAWSGVCFAAIPYMALSSRFLAEKSAPLTPLLGLACIAALGTFYHPGFLIVVAFGLMALAAMSIGNLNWQRVIAYTLFIPAFTFATNYFWISASVTYAPSPIEGFLPTPSLAKVDPTLPWKLMLGKNNLWPYGAKVYLLLMCCGVYALFATENSREKLVARALFGGSAALLLFGALGAAIPGLAYAQPNRYCQAGFAMQMVPASIGMVAMYREATRRTIGVRHSLRRGVSWLVASMALLAMLFCLNEVRRELSSASIGHYGAIPPEVKGVGDTTNALKNWIEANTSPAGRILFEVTAGKRLDSAQIVGYLAASTGREFIGGPYPSWAYASFEDEKLFGTPIALLPREKFLKLIELYNIAFIGAWSDKSRKYLDESPGLENMGEVGPVRFYRVNRENSYFISGSGKVAGRSPNSLTLEAIEGSEVILKYHFVKGLLAEPPVEMEPVYAGSPAPFIKLVNPPPKLRIYMGK
ncbi:hypothetical protein [Roseateles sp. LKC17W]|uniref:hypothetical protein n=1 Tax=Pelomonas margarita TaxID=3299031 RepID=UPI003749C05C